MILPDHEIERRAERFEMISPYNHEQLQPSSYDVLLGNTFRVFPFRNELDWIDPFNQGQLNELTTRLERNDGEQFVIQPQAFILASTKEYVKVPDDLVCRLEGKSSLGRLGLAVHITAGYIDPGFHGNITLEMVNFANKPIVLTPGMAIAQIGFIMMMSPARTSYAGRYQGDTGAVQSRYGKDK